MVGVICGEDNICNFWGAVYCHHQQRSPLYFCRQTTYLQVVQTSNFCQVGAKSLHAVKIELEKHALLYRQLSI